MTPKPVDHMLRDVLVPSPTIDPDGTSLSATFDKCVLQLPT
jgi:hypothetical protein